MAKQKDFDAFLKNIEPSKSTKEYISSVQNNLRDYLKNHSKYKEIYIDTFLSGSYAKHTSIRPACSDKKRDVDIIVVTSYSFEANSIDVLNELKDILIQKDTYKNATIQSHSIGIELSEISIDVVPVIKSEDDDQLYYVGSSKENNWTLTDPKGHKSWSSSVNSDHNQKYKPLVKIFKWWRRTHCPSDVKYPKGITLEKTIADNIGDSTLNTEDLVIATMQNIVSAYKEDYIDKEKMPIIDDPSEKIEDNDLLSGYTFSDFSSFVSKIEEHIELLNTDGNSNNTWKKILGTEFPSDQKAHNSFEISSLYKCLSATHKQKPTWRFQPKGTAFISLKVTAPDGTIVDYCNNGTPLKKHCGLRFRALTNIKKPYQVMWQIVNTGREAQTASCLRGNFEHSDDGPNGKIESTAYSGSHSVQCFIIKNGDCVAKSKEFIINIE